MGYENGDIAYHNIRDCAVDESDSAAESGSRANGQNLGLQLIFVLVMVPITRQPQTSVIIGK